MYDPKGNGRTKETGEVRFVEQAPPSHLSTVVHRFLELKTTDVLAEDYCFHALPDACTYIVFDQRTPEVAGVSQLRATSDEFNLGREFHFINIRLLPGVWRGPAEGVVQGVVDVPYEGKLPLQRVNKALGEQGFEAGVPLLETFVEKLIMQGFVAPNPMLLQILQNLDEIHTVADMAGLAGLSSRQLQRRLKSATGFAPHDLLKVLRLQQALVSDGTLSYADQSHFIHSFRAATGYTPGKYAKKFDV